MPKVVLYNQNGSNVGELELNDHVFGVEDNQQVIYDTVIAERAAMRQGTQKVKRVQKYVVVVANHGVKKEQDVQDKVQFVLHNGVVVVLFLHQLRDLMLLKSIKKLLDLQCVVH